MYLTKEEERALSGEYGAALQKAYEILVALGEVMDAERLVPIKSAQIAGVSYKNIGDAGLELLNDFASMGAKVKVLSTLNPAGMDLERWREMGIEEKFARKQLEIIQAFRRMGVRTTCTCTPYLIGNKPEFGSHVAWSESSAVAFANSILGARTNREGGISALAAAVAGKTPLMGFHLPENRAPKIEVQVKVVVDSVMKASLLGYVVGELSSGEVPLVKGRICASIECLKAFSAAAATSGGLALFHIEGVTAEALKRKKITTTHEERVQVDEEEMRQCLERLSARGEVDLVAIGCPHCTLEEILEMARALKGRRVRRDCRFWVFTSREVYSKAAEKGYVKIIEEAGGMVFSDTCMVVAPLDSLGIKRVATNSAKAAHYVPSTIGAEAVLTETASCIEMALG